MAKEEPQLLEHERPKVRAILQNLCLREMLRRLRSGEIPVGLGTLLG